jgi:hypothetical protein
MTAGLNTYLPHNSTGEYMVVFATIFATGLTGYAGWAVYKLLVS